MDISVSEQQKTVEVWLTHDSPFPVNDGHIFIARVDIPAQSCYNSHKDKYTNVSYKLIVSPDTVVCKLAVLKEG